MRSLPNTAKRGMIRKMNDSVVVALKTRLIYLSVDRGAYHDRLL
jgi:hypothetical protein